MNEAIQPTAEDALPGGLISRKAPLTAEDSANIRNRVITLVAFGLVYYFAVLLGSALYFPSSTIAVIWPSNALLVAVLLTTERRWWKFFFLAVALMHLAAMVGSHLPIWRIFWQIAVNILLAGGMASSIRLIVRGTLDFDNLSHWCGFTIAGVTASCIISLLSAGFVLSGLHSKTGIPDWIVWRQVALSNITGILLLTPVIVLWITRAKSWFDAMSWRHLTEPILLGIGIITVGLLAFGERTGSNLVPALVFLPLPLLILAAFRFGTTGVSHALLGVVALSLFGAMRGEGPFINSASAANVLSMQLYWIVLYLTLMPVAALVRERTLAQTAAHQNEERLRLALAAAAMGTWDWDIASDRITWSAESQCLFGLTSVNNVISRESLLTRIHPDDSSAVLLAMKHALNQKTYYEQEFRVRTANGSPRWVSVRGEVLRNESNKPVRMIGVFLEISDRKRADEARQNLAHASRLAVVGELTAMVAHEINQPLGAILNNAEAAEMLLDSPEAPIGEIRQILADIRKDDVRASEAIRRIRSLLQKRQMERHPLDLNETIADVLQLAAGDALRRRVQILKKFTPGLPGVRGDRVHLQQVLLNLVLNGMDAVSGNPESKRQLIISTSCNASGDLEVAVADCGHGIAQDKLTQIFDLFFTTKRDGMGLGLSIAQSIIEFHHGRIWAENNDLGGATFRFSLPPDGQKTSGELVS
jgi:PAS domain S-box-containing protein